MTLHELEDPALLKTKSQEQVRENIKRRLKNENNNEKAVWAEKSLLDITPTYY